MFLFYVIDASKSVLTFIERRKKMIRMISATVLLLCMLIMSGCHTVHGVGQDVESGGRAIERSSGK
jgi:entericidin B